MKKSVKNKEKNLESGQVVVVNKDSYNIYLGKWTPKRRFGISLKKTYNVFATSKDLPKAMRSYPTVVKYVAELKNWEGFNGTNYANEKAFYQSLKNNTYTGGWFIPPCDLMMGATPGGNNKPDGIMDKRTNSTNLFDCQNKGAFNGTCKSVGDGTDYSDCYWTSTEVPELDWGLGWMYCVSLSNGGVSRQPDEMGIGRAFCRLMRLEPTKLKK